MKLTAAAVAVALCVLAACQARDAEVLRNPPRFYEDVAPILSRSCTCCHRPGFDAPSLVLPGEVAARMDSILAEVGAATMPPLPEGPRPIAGCSSLIRATPALTVDEVELLRRWNEQGRRTGDASVAPPTPTDCNPPRRGRPLSIDLPAGGAADGEEVTAFCYGIDEPIAQDGVVVGTRLTTASSQLRSVVLLGSRPGVEIGFGAEGGPCPPYQPPTGPVLGMLWAGETHQDFPAGAGVPVFAGERLAAVVEFDRRFRDARGDFDAQTTRLELDIVEPDAAPTALAPAFASDVGLQLAPGGRRSASATSRLPRDAGVYGAVLMMNDYGRSIVGTLGADGETACALEEPSWFPSAVRNLMFDPPLHDARDLRVECTYDLTGLPAGDPLVRVGFPPEGELCQMLVWTEAPPEPDPPPAGDVCERMWGAVDHEAGDLAPGGAFALVRGGRVECAREWGVRRFGEELPVDDQTLFRWGATSTSIAGLVTLELAAQGRVDLDQPVVEILEPLLGDLGIEPRAWAERVTIRHLVERTAGLPEDGTAEFLLDDCDRTGPDALAFLQTFTEGGRVMIAEPGLTSADGRVAKVMLGASVEAATGETFAALAQDVLFEPLGMHDSWFGWNDRLDAERVYGHAVAGVSVTPLDQPGQTCDAATVPEGLTTSVADARRLLTVLARGGLDEDGTQVLDATTIAGLLTGVVPSFKQSTTLSGPFGEVFGGGPAPGAGPAALVYREGPGPGYLMSMTFSPGAGFGVFEMLNVGDGWVSRRAATTVATSDDGWAWPTADYGPGQRWDPRPEDLAEYAGRYVGARGQPCSVLEQDEITGQLTWTADGTTTRLCPLSVDRFGLGGGCETRVMPWISFYRDVRADDSPIYVALRSAPGSVYYPEHAVPPGLDLDETACAW